MTTATKPKLNKKAAPRTWRKLKAPEPWRAEAGDELIGKFVKSEVRDGPHGDYRSHVVQADGKLWYITGRAADDLFAMVAPGTTIKLVFRGYVPVGDDGHNMKLFDMYVEADAK